MSTGKLTEQAQFLPVNKTEQWFMERRNLQISIDDLEEGEIPDILICFSPVGNIIGSTIVMPDAPDEEVITWAIKCMMSPSFGAPHRPGKVILSGGKLNFLQDTLKKLGINVIVLETPHPAVDNIMAEFLNEFNAPGLPPYFSEEDYKDTQIVEAFFQSTAEFYKQKPWKYFDIELPIKVEIEINDEQFTYWAIITGTNGESYGLVIYESYHDLSDVLDVDDIKEAFDVMQDMWSMNLSYLPVKDIGRLAQRELEENDWTIANKSAYPSVFVMDPEENTSRLPNFEEMSHFHVIALALSLFFKDNKKQVKAHLRNVGSVWTAQTNIRWPDHEVPVSIQIPAQEYLEELADIFDYEDDDIPVSVMGGSSIPSSPLGRAYEYIYQATQTDSKSQMVKLAKQALAICPDCVDGYLILAYQTARDDAEKLKFLKQAVDAGKRICSREGMKAIEGHYWHIMDTRPYLRAIDDLAEFQVEIGNYEDAIDNYKELIRLNPKDHQDIRYDLANCYLMTRKYDELEKLLKTYKQDQSAPLLFASALMKFALQGDSKQASNKLKRAIKENQYVTNFILEENSLPNREVFEYESGSKDEAIFYAQLAMNTWRQTQGAIEWLRKIAGDN